MPSVKPLPPARRSIRPLASDTLETIAQRELPDMPRDEAVANLKEWNPHLARRRELIVLVSDVIFLEPPPFKTNQGGF